MRFERNQVKIAFPAEIIRDINTLYQKLFIVMTGRRLPTAEISPALTMILNSPRVIRVRGRDISCSTGLMKRLAIHMTVPAATIANQLPLNLTPDGNTREESQSEPTHTSHLINKFILIATD